MSRQTNTFEFGPFRLNMAECLLALDAQAIRLEPQVLKTLQVLVENSGHLCEKRWLLEQVWGDTCVEEGNLARNISVLRKVLGDGSDGYRYIETVPKRGYRFVAPVRELTNEASDGLIRARTTTEENSSDDSLLPIEATQNAPDSEFIMVDATAERLAETGVKTFVGRVLELKRLEGFLYQAIEGVGRVAFITGESGIGKTSLAAEFLRRAREQQQGLILGLGRCLEQYGTGEAYLPWLDAIGAVLISSGRERLMSALQIFAPTWCLQFPSIFGALEQLQRETIGATKERMLREMGDALGALATRSPVVLVLEDLHWADPSSVDLLRHLSQRISGKRLLIVGTLRPEALEWNNHLKNYWREMHAHKLFEEIGLEALNQEQLSNYLDKRFAPNDFPQEFVTLLERKTEGHPLFATSLIDFLSELGDIARVDAHWTLTRPLAQMDMEAPANVRGMIRKKIEGLEEQERRALQYASIEGEEFLSTVVAELLGIDDLALDEQLDHIARSHHLIKILGEEELPDGKLAIRYRFSHVLYQNVLYDELTTRRRITLHRQAGELLLQHYDEQAASNATQLAMHFERGRDFIRAIEYLTHAGDNATRFFANEEAEKHYGRALGLVKKLQVEERAEKAIPLYHKRGTVNHIMSRYDAAVDDFTQMFELARAVGVPAQEHAALYAMSITLFWSHRLEEMSVRTAEALHVAERSGSQALRLETMVLVALKHQIYGDLAQARRLYDEVIRLAREINHKRALLDALTWRGFVHFFQSEYVKAETVLVEARGLASELRDGFRLLVCLFCSGMVQGNMGRMSQALRTFNEAIEMANRNGDHAVQSKLPNCLGWIYRELQDFDNACRLDHSGVEIAREDHVPEAEAHSLINLGYDYTLEREGNEAPRVFRKVEAICAREDWLRWRYNIRLQAGQAEYWFAQGDLERAQGYAQRLLESATHHEVPKYIAVAHKLLAEVSMARGELAEAEKQFSASLDQLCEYPAPLVAWKTHAGLGRLLQQKGEHQEARKAFAQAATVVNLIASNVEDEKLRATFLNSSAVREVLIEEARN